MTRFTPAVLVFALFAGSIPAADPDPRSMKGVFGQLQPHGEPVSNAFIGLYAGRTNLHFGQPMRVLLFTHRVTEDGPHIRAYIGDTGNMKHVYPYWGDNGNAKLELTDDQGKAVPFRVEARSDDLMEFFNLWPTGPHAAGVYWKPGTYRLKATVTMPKDPPQANWAVGTFRSNELTLTVREPGALLDTWDGKGELRKSQPNATPSTYADDVFLYVAGLDDVSSDRLRRECKWEAAPWRVAAARFAPVTVPQDRKLTDAETNQLIADLGHDGPATRIRAVRSVSLTAPAKVIAAALDLLTDDYKQPHGQIHPTLYHPVRLAAADAFAQLGPVVLEPLIAFADRTKRDEVTNAVIGILARIGPHQSSEDYLRRLVRAYDPGPRDGGPLDYRYAVQQALAAWGKGGVPLTREILTTPGMHGFVRREAVAVLGKHGDTKTDGPAVRKQLGDRDVTEQAAWSLLALKHTDALPDMERVLRDPQSGLGEGTRSNLFHVFFRLAEEKDGDRLALSLLEDGEPAMRSHAAHRLAFRKNLAAVPVLLTELESKERSTRKWADDALRALVGEPKGVGFNPDKPDPKLWRDHWAKKDKR